jgi:hypothetical protein
MVDSINNRNAPLPGNLPPVQNTVPPTTTTAAPAAGGVTAVGAGASPPAGAMAAAAAQDVPYLPNVAGKGGSLPQMKSGSAQFWINSKPMSVADILDLIAKLTGEQERVHGKIRTQAGLGAATMAFASAGQQEAMVAGDRKSALNNLIGNLVGTTLVLGMGGLSGYFGFATNAGSEGKAALQGALQAGSMATSQLVNSITSYIDTTQSWAGGKFKSDQAKIEKAYIDAFLQQYKTLDETFNSSYENSRKKFESAIDTQRQIQDSKNSTSMNIAQNV